MRVSTPAYVVLGLLVSTFATSSGCGSGDSAASSGSGTASGGSGGASNGTGTGTGGLGGSISIGATTTTGAAGAGGIGGAGGSGGTGASDCIFVPPPGMFMPQVDCSWTGNSSTYAARDDVVMTPVVVNLTDDTGDNIVDTNDIPDIAFIAYRLQEDGCCNTPGVLRVLSGACNPDGTMNEHFSVGATEIQADTGVANVWLDNSGGLAAGDIDGDGFVDLVATIVSGGTIAFERDGHVKWIQPNHPKSPNHLAGTTPSIADLDHDGFPEVIQGRVVLNGVDGTLKWAGTGGVGVNAFMGPVSAVGDPDLNGTMNVLAGNTMYELDGTPVWTYAFPTPADTTNCAAPAAFTCDGYTATGNFDGDDFGEIVIVRAGAVYILNHDGTVLDVGGIPAIIDIPKSSCARNEGGPPTVADFDGDGQAEIGVAAANFYIVADLECLNGNMPPQCSDVGIRWKVPNQDCSSRVTGSSVFDFDGNGRAEVVYNDEQRFRIMDGIDGTILIDIPNHSHTRLEMPIVADVDNDGNAEIVFVENAYGGAGQGIRVWGDAMNSWVATRRIWNQHAYHVTNVNEDGSIPVFESPNWLEPTNGTVAGKMNNFRQNLPDFDVFAAPDLTVTLTVNEAYCPSYLGLEAKVCNEGALVVGAGASVTFYDNMTQVEIPCANAPIKTTVPLAPGKCQTVTCEWTTAPKAPATVDTRACVDNGGYSCSDTTTGNNECKEDNNKSDGTGKGCMQPT